MELIWLDVKTRSSVFQFYKRFMPYARIKQKENIAILVKAADCDVICASDIDTEQIIAAIRFRPIGQFDLLIGMLVHPEHRGKGIGHEILNRINGRFVAQRTYLFALPELVGFYQQHGFSENIKAPNDINQLYKKYTLQGKVIVLMGYQIEAPK